LGTKTGNLASSSHSVMRIADLTPREQQVLRLIAEGHSDPSLAAVLGISFRTANCHRKNIFRKAGGVSVVNVLRKFYEFKERSA
jgi:DNA-binding CsgD family transcriptional regulator